MVQHNLIDHTGVTGVSGNVAADAIWDTKGDLAAATAANTASKLAVGTNNQVLTAASGQSTGLQWQTTGSSQYVLYGKDHFAATVDAGTWAFISSAWTEGPPPYGGWGWQNTTGAQNDAVTWTLFFQAGTYSIKVRGRRSTNIGILTFKVDGGSVGTLDYYAASADYSVQTITGVAITAGSHTLQLIMATKNASSSNYFSALYDITIYRTA